MAEGVLAGLDADGEGAEEEAGLEVLVYVVAVVNPGEVFAAEDLVVTVSGYLLAS